MKKIIPFHKEIPFKTNLAEITSISLEHTIHPDANTVKGSFIVSGEYKISENSNCVEAFSYDLPFESTFENCNLDKAIIDIHDFYYEIVNSSVLTVHIELCVQNIIEDPIVVNIKVDESEEIEKQVVSKEEEIEELVREKVEETGVSKLDTIEQEIQELFAKEEEEEAKKIEPVEEIKEVKAQVVQAEIEEIKKEEEKEDRPAMETEEVKKIESKEEEKMEEYVEEREQENKIDEILEQMDTKETYATYKVYIVRENDSLETIIEKYDTSRDDLALYNDLNEIKIGDKIMIPSQHA
ncbi:MAG: LysM peptidoglycan-binding domain-containing protein [Firmicutes bacterium]|nr:LysM peptidoglycan-binding domain-containing protein [Bacillota bacterium]